MSILLSNPANKKGIIQNGLVLNLDGKDFQNNPPTIIWKDRSGQGNNAIASNFGYTTSSGSNNLGGVAFDGVDDKVATQSNITIIGNQSRTLEVTISNLTDTGSKIIIGYGTGSTTGATFIFYVLSNKFYFSGYLTADLASTKVINDGKKYTLTASHDGTTLKLYVNGILNVSKANVLNTSSNTPLALGQPGSTNFKMYNVRLYNRALTDQEILQNYNASR